MSLWGTHEPVNRRKGASPAERGVEAARLGALRGQLRISASLDLDTVLQETVEAARELTGARYGVIATTDERGRSADFVTSGFTEQEHLAFQTWSDGPRLFEHFLALERPMRSPDARAYVRALGFSGTRFPPKACQGTPVSHLGVPVGIFCLVEKERDEEFTDDDEEILMLFASHAGAAIAHARAHRAERRARADLEALVDTVPIGVVVFDAHNAKPLSLNGEARRIVAALHSPGKPDEAALDTIRLRREDGRETSLRELPLAELARGAKTVRARHIELRVPDGRSVRALVNAMPIRAGAAGEQTDTVVATLLDLATLEEIERAHALSLATVSHELRVPLSSIRGSAAALLEESSHLGRAEKEQFARIIVDQTIQMGALIKDLLDSERIRLGTLSLDRQPSAVGVLIERARSTFLAAATGHSLHVDLPARLPPITADPERIVQVLLNLLSNAARHCEASLPIRVEAAHTGAHVTISIADRGAGIAPERLANLFSTPLTSPGTRRPLGLQICKGIVEAHGGQIRAESAGPGEGARFTFTVPVARRHDDAPRRHQADSVSASPTSRRSGRRPGRILVVDDDPQTLRVVREVISSAGYTALVSAEPRDLARTLRTERPDLVLLDLVFDGTDGIELMERTPQLPDIPVIFLSAYGRDETIARALSAGATDYIVKPFSPTELVARIGASLRRRPAALEPFVLGALTIDYDARRVTVDSRPVALTATEYALLCALADNAGRVSTYQALLRAVWPRRTHDDTELVRVYVKRLRRKLGDRRGRPRHIINERGVGYRMERGDGSEPR